MGNRFNPSPNELYHWKYVRKYRSNGEWRYEYPKEERMNIRRERDSLNSVTQFARTAANQSLKTAGLHGSSSEQAKIATSNMNMANELLRERAQQLRENREQRAIERNSRGIPESEFSRLNRLNPGLGWYALLQNDDDRIRAKNSLQKYAYNSAEGLSNKHKAAGETIVDRLLKLFDRKQASPIVKGDAK